jgi:predicted DNA-binding protein YlxM (UPF0122 family)
MEEKKAFYTVAEAAELLGVSRQAIYQALNKNLKPFSSKVDGRIVIESAAFSDVVDKQLNKQVDKENDNRQSNIQALVQEVDKLKIQLVEAERREKMLTDQLEYLKEQIKTKDETIEGLRIALDQQQKLQLLTQQQPKQIGGFFKRLFGHKDE